MIKFKILWLFILFCSILLINTAYASDFDQTINDDNFDAIQNLIDDAASGDSIYLQDTTYKGNGSAVNINKDISIYGSNSTILDANNKSSIFKISKGVTVNFVGLTLTNGNAFKGDGGAIYNLGKLTISNSTVSNNSAAIGGAIFCDSYSSLTIYNSLFDSNHATGGAGAIDNYQCDLKVVNSTFSNNIGHEGGAIYNKYSNFWVYDSLFVNNSATRGGGVYNNKGLMKIYNSKFYSNNASHLGGGIKSFGDCEVHDSIIKDNIGYQGGGLFVSQNTMKVTNCTVENNKAYEGGGFFTDVKATLIIKETSIVNNSAEVDGGGINVYQGYLTLTNSNLSDNYAPNCGGGIFYSDYPYTSTISNLKLTDNNAKYGGGIYVGTLTVKMSNINLTGNSAIDGGAIYNTGSLTLTSMNFNSNKASRNGGAIYSNNDLSLSNSIAGKNNALMYGGVIYTTASLNVNNLNCTSNEAKYAAIYSSKPAKITNSNFDANKAYDTGVIYSSDDLIVDTCNFTNNKITRTYGGVMFLLNGNVNITDSVFSNNKGSDEGGVIFNLANVYLNNTKFLSNNAISYGGAINNDGNMIIENSVFDKNEADYSAGVIDNGGELKIVNSNFTNNKANVNNGGAIDNGGKMTVIGSIFENNIARNNGGAIIARRNINVSHSVFYNNNDKNGYTIFNESWEDNSISNNWWGSNKPDFSQLLNFNTSDDFNWIIMNVTPTTSLVQGKNASFDVSFANVLDKNNSSSKLENPELLPIFEVYMSTGEVLSVADGRIEKSLKLPKTSSISFNTDNLMLAFSLAINPDSIKRITNNKDVYVYYTGKATFKVRVIGDDGKPVGAGVIIVMKVGKTSYKVKTDKNGYASKVFTNKPGKYTVTTTYKNYSVKNILRIVNVLHVKMVTTKKKAKTIKYTATLQNGNGKLLAGKTVTFKINGKTYSAKTNKKGVATVSFKNLKVGKYSVVVKYLKSQIITTLKVKK